MLVMSVKVVHPGRRRDVRTTPTAINILKKPFQATKPARVPGYSARTSEAFDLTPRSDKGKGSRHEPHPRHDPPRHATKQRGFGRGGAGAAAAQLLWVYGLRRKRDA